jgi:hypothetical protein
MVEIPNCACPRYAGTPCRAKCDAEDLLCSICRPGDCVIFTLDAQAGRFAAAGIGPAHARMWLAPRGATDGITVRGGVSLAVEGGRYTVAQATIKGPR